MNISSYQNRNDIESQTEFKFQKFDDHRIILKLECLQINNYKKEINRNF